MTPATELATLPLASGATIEDADSSAGKVWQSTLDTVSQQDGFQRCYWGREVENQSVVQLFVGKTNQDSLARPSATNCATDTPFTPDRLGLLRRPQEIHRFPHLRPFRQASYDYHRRSPHYVPREFQAPPSHRRPRRRLPCHRSPDFLF